MIETAEPHYLTAPAHQCGAPGCVACQVSRCHFYQAPQEYGRAKIPEEPSVSNRAAEVSGFSMFPVTGWCDRCGVNHMQPFLNPREEGAA